VSYACFRSNDICNGLIRGNCDYEVPGIGELENELWKGKADILNHDEKLIIDLKTTADLNKFRWSASKYNYCSPEFLQRGADKVKKAVEQYQLFYRQEGFDPSQFFINETL
jgi:hypothetical protein